MHFATGGLGHNPGANWLPGTGTTEPYCPELDPTHARQRCPSSSWLGLMDPSQHVASATRVGLGGSPEGCPPPLSPTHLFFRCCPLPRHRNRPFTMMAMRVHRASHSSMLPARDRQCEPPSTGPPAPTSSPPAPFGGREPGPGPWMEPQQFPQSWGDLRWLAGHCLAPGMAWSKLHPGDELVYA